jgi:hypothetical protein
MLNTKNKGFVAVCSLVILGAIWMVGCGYVVSQSTDSKQAQAEEQRLAEARREVPTPAIVNWNELRLAKLIQEKRDQQNLTTWTYKFSGMTGKYTFVCESIGYGLPYNTRTNNPQHYEFVTTTQGASAMGSGGGGYYSDGQGHTIWGEHTVMPQPEPNGLFIPDSAKGTWNLCKDPVTGKADVTYQEEDISVFPYKLPTEMVEGFHPATLSEEKKK